MICVVSVDDLEKFASMCHADTLDQPTDAKVEYIEASKYKEDHR